MTMPACSSLEVSKLTWPCCLFHHCPFCKGVAVDGSGVTARRACLAPSDRRTLERRMLDGSVRSTPWSITTSSCPKAHSPCCLERPSSLTIRIIGLCQQITPVPCPDVIVRPSQAARPAPFCKRGCRPLPLPSRQCCFRVDLAAEISATVTTPGGSRGTMRGDASSCVSRRRPRSLAALGCKVRASSYFCFPAAGGVPRSWMVRHTAKNVVVAGVTAILPSRASHSSVFRVAGPLAMASIAAEMDTGGVRRYGDCNAPFPSRYFHA